MYVPNRAAYEEPSWFPVPHPDAELSRADIDEAIEAEIIFALDRADDRLTAALDRLARLPLPPGHWESRADVGADIRLAQAELRQALDALDPQRREEPRP